MRVDHTRHHRHEGGVNQRVSLTAEDGWRRTRTQRNDPIVLGKEVAGGDNVAAIIDCEDGTMFILYVGQRGRSADVLIKTWLVITHSPVSVD
jgi:hypothetical protein